MHAKTEYCQVPRQLKLVEQQLGTSFTVKAQHANLFGWLSDEYGRGLTFKDGIVSSYHLSVDLKKEYPEQYAKFVAGLTEIRRKQYNAIAEFLDPTRVQQYPVFIPEWNLDPKMLECGRKNNDWLKNEGQNYFLKYQFKPEFFPGVSEKSEIFYSHCTIGPGIASFARLFPQANITAGDINPKVCEKCSKYLADAGIRNVKAFIDQPAEDLSTLSSNKFDTVITHEAIWFDNPFRAFSEYCRILKPGGQLIGSATSDHDTTMFFEQFAKVYQMPAELKKYPGFQIITVDVSEEVKTKMQLDLKLLSLLTGQISTEPDLKLKPFYDPKEFFIHHCDKSTIQGVLAGLASKPEILDSLRRLFKIACDGKLNPEASYNSIAIIAL